MAVAAVGTAMLLGLSVEGEGGLVLIAVASTIISVGLGPVITLATELIVGSAPPEQAGAATGISETSGELGGALGIAILGSLGTAVYRSRVADSLPADIPAEVADAALDTLGGALAVAESLPGALADAVVAAAQVAFVDALHLVAAVAAILAVVTAIVCRHCPAEGARPVRTARGGSRAGAAGRCRLSPQARTAAIASISTRHSGRPSARTKATVIAVGRSPHAARDAANPSFRSTPSTRWIVSFATSSGEAPASASTSSRLRMACSVCGPMASLTTSPSAPTPFCPPDDHDR